MSQGTAIGNLGNGISDEDARLVDSILNDINGPPQQQQQQQQQPQQQQQQQPQQQQQQQQQQPSPEQMKMMQQQQAMRQQQQASQQMGQNIIQNSSEGAILDNIKHEAKNVAVVMFLCILLNVEQVDGAFKSATMFVGEGGSLNTQAVVFKAILIGTVFYLIKTYLL